MVWTYSASSHAQKWSSILDLRPQTVYMSFGTFAQAHAMPEAYKETIRRSAKAFPDVTFIWKYEVRGTAERMNESDPSFFNRFSVIQYSPLLSSINNHGFSYD